MSLSPEPEAGSGAENESLEASQAVYTLPEKSPQHKEDPIQTIAELELLKYDLENERLRCESLQKELLEKDKSLSVSTSTLNEKRVEIAKLKHKNLELTTQLAESQGKWEGMADTLKGENEVARGELTALRAKLEQSERARMAQLSLCRGQMKEMKSKYKGQITELKQLLAERHSRYKEKENTFLQEKSRISSQLEQFQSKVQQFCESKVSTARTSANVTRRDPRLKPMSSKPVTANNTDDESSP